MLIVSDENWKCTNESPVIFNQLRNGEYYDSRILCETWRDISFDDSLWENAIIDKTPPRGIFRECKCEPIREMEILTPKRIIKTRRDSYLFEYEKNISGYIRLNVNEKSGVTLTIKYGERIDKDNCVNSDWVDPQFYKGSVFQTDKFICNGKECIWSPRFTYHGFSYIEIEGLSSEPNINTAYGVFVHQAVKRISFFECSNELFNKIFECGILSTKSNLHYLPTDCPSREKLGWMNDASVSTEQFLTNFDITKFLEKWFYDILDAMKENGELSSIVPTAGWGYDWGSGPLMGSALFEIPYRIYEYTGDSFLLNIAYPYFKKYLSFITKKINEDGLIDFGLVDWAGPFENLSNPPTPREFTDTAIYMNLLKISSFTANLFEYKDEKENFEKEYINIKKSFDKKYMNDDNSCKIFEQTALAYIICGEFYEDISKLKLQLEESIKKHNYHLDCGMIGMRYLFHALNKCNIPEYAYKILTSTEYPSYGYWINNGATTLWETWQCNFSKNHHMFSDVLSWMMKTVVGISPNIQSPGYKIINIKPIFFSELSYAKGSIDTKWGTIKVNWKKNVNEVNLIIEIPKDTVGNLILDDKTIILEHGIHKINHIIKNN